MQPSWSSLSLNVAAMAAGFVSMQCVNSGI